MRTALSLAVVVVLVTEMFAGTTFGIGHEIIEAELTYRMKEMYAWICIAGLLGYGLNKVSLLCERRIVHWGGR